MLGIEEKCWKRKKEMMDLVRSEEENKGVTLDLDRRPEAEAEAYGSLLFSSLLSSSLLSSPLLFSSLLFSCRSRTRSDRIGFTFFNGWTGEKERWYLPLKWIMENGN
jgi:hypothetical protein